jgi:hypothetical protein
VWVSEILDEAGSRSAKAQIEHIIGVLIGLTPLILIAVVFRNDDAACVYYLKHYSSIAGIISSFIAIVDRAREVLAGNTKFSRVVDLSTFWKKILYFACVYAPGRIRFRWEEDDCESVDISAKPALCAQEG